MRGLERENEGTAMWGLNIVLVSDFLVGFTVAWILRGVCDKLEGRLFRFFKKDKS